MAVIEFEHVSKSYQLGAYQKSLREVIPQMTRKLFSRNNGHPDDQLFWALNDVNFAVEKGEILGIIGHNGAGKSTILKLLSKVSYPTSGRIHTQGRMAALIELGAGFHPDLSGRENIYLNGAILGLTQREIQAQFSNIVEFAGLEKFIDTPIKRYSSGMYVRLAFAVAAHIQAELLLVDEVLAVGDMTFQQKCMAKMNELRDNGTTIVFISHNLAAVQSFCSRVLLLNSGQILANGDPSEVIQIYKQQEREAERSVFIQAEASKNGSGATVGPDKAEATATNILSKVELLDSTGQPSRDFQSEGSLTVRCHYNIARKMNEPEYMIRVRRHADSFICFSRYMDDPIQTSLQGQGVFEVCIDHRLLPGLYTLEAYIFSQAFLDDEVVVSTPEIFSVAGELPDDDEGIYYPNVKVSIDISKAQPEPEPQVET